MEHSSQLNRLFLSKQGMSDMVDLWRLSNNNDKDMFSLIKNSGQTLTETKDGEPLSAFEIFKADQGFMVLLTVRRDPIKDEDQFLLARIMKLDQKLEDVDNRRIITNSFKREDFKGIFLLNYDEFYSRRLKNV